MERIKVIIVDDVKLIRMELYAMLSSYPEIEVIGEANNGQKAKEIITKLKPDVVFLDIRLPKLTGFELLECIEIDFQVVFISSYDKYFSEVQKYNAIDFLMKPVRREDLDKAIQKLVQNFNEVKNLDFEKTTQYFKA